MRKAKEIYIIDKGKTLWNGIHSFHLYLFKPFLHLKFLLYNGFNSFCFHILSTFTLSLFYFYLLLLYHSARYHSIWIQTSEEVGNTKNMHSRLQNQPWFFPLFCHFIAPLNWCSEAENWKHLTWLKLDQEFPSMNIYRRFLIACFQGQEQIKMR